MIFFFLGDPLTPPHARPEQGGQRPNTVRSQMTSPRLRRRRGSIFSKKEALFVFVRVVAFVIACVLVCVLGLLKRGQSRQQQYPLLSQLHRSTLQETIVPIPIDATKIVDLWPDDSHKGAEPYRSSLSECIPAHSSNWYPQHGYGGGSNNNHCQVRAPESEHARDDGHGNGSIKPTQQRVALVHSPGKIGDVFVQYVTRVLNLSLSPNSTDNISNERDEVAHSIELVSSSQIIETQHQSTLPYSKIIRMATLPILLDATDLLLAHDSTLGSITQGGTHNKGRHTIQDILDLVRQLVRWQCHMSKHSNDTPLLTITLHRMMGFSSMTTRKIQSFLDLTPPSDNPKHNRIAMDDISLVVTDIIDNASSTIQRLLVMNETLAHKSAANLNDIVNDLVKEELNGRTEDARGAAATTTACRPLSVTGLKLGSPKNAIVAKMMA